MVIADVKDEESIKSMCERAKIVINCVGPYRFYGETVVKQCLLAGAHHVDVSGEPEVTLKEICKIVSKFYLTFFDLVSRKNATKL